MQYVQNNFINFEKIKNKQRGREKKETYEEKQVKPEICRPTSYQHKVSEETKEEGMKKINNDRQEEGRKEGRKEEKIKSDKMFMLALL